MSALLSRYEVVCTLFFFNDTATTEIYTLSLHDALPIIAASVVDLPEPVVPVQRIRPRRSDRKSTRLNSSHVEISYAVFCLQKKNAHSLSFDPCRRQGGFFACARDQLFAQGFFFFNDTAPTESYTLSLHDALPIYRRRGAVCAQVTGLETVFTEPPGRHGDLERVRVVAASGALGEQPVLLQGGQGGLVQAGAGEQLVAAEPQVGRVRRRLGRLAF